MQGGLKGCKMPLLSASTLALTGSFQLPVPQASLGPTRGTKEGREFWDPLGGTVRNLPPWDVLGSRRLRVIHRRTRTEEPLCCGLTPAGSSAPRGSALPHLPQRWGGDGKGGSEETRLEMEAIPRVKEKLRVQAKQEEDPARSLPPAGSCSAISRRAGLVARNGLWGRQTPSL